LNYLRIEKLGACDTQPISSPFDRRQTFHGVTMLKDSFMRPSDPEQDHQVLIPKWAVPLVWSIIVLVIQILLPWVVARIMPRFGWHQQSPAYFNWLGLGAVFIGLGLYAWCLAFHFKTYSNSVRLIFSPPKLVIDGLYRVSRNPMYLSGLLVRFGWSLFYGSPAVFIATLLLWAIFAFRVIPQEERQLRQLFGDDYLQYESSISRWFGKV
jgi:protein-S-isoprenylcysteine O-methyltransferase Ste14